MPSNSLSDVIDYITIQSEGNAIDFGDMVQGARYYLLSQMELVLNNGWCSIIRCTMIIHLIYQH